MSKLYQARRIIKYNDRPVSKVEVIDRSCGNVTFKTDYPVEEITVTEGEFNKYFSKWR